MENPHSISAVPSLNSSRRRVRTISVSVRVPAGDVFADTPLLKRAPRLRGDEATPSSKARSPQSITGPVPFPKASKPAAVYTPVRAPIAKTSLPFAQRGSAAVASRQPHTPVASTRLKPVGPTSSPQVKQSPSAGMSMATQQLPTPPPTPPLSQQRGQIKEKPLRIVATTARKTNAKAPVSTKDVVTRGKAGKEISGTSGQIVVKKRSVVKKAEPTKENARPIAAKVRLPAPRAHVTRSHTPLSPLRNQARKATQETEISTVSIKTPVVATAPVDTVSQDDGVIDAMTPAPLDDATQPKALEPANGSLTQTAGPQHAFPQVVSIVLNTNVVAVTSALQVSEERTSAIAQDVQLNEVKAAISLESTSDRGFKVFEKCAPRGETTNTTSGAIGDVGSNATIVQDEAGELEDMVSRGAYAQNVSAMGSSVQARIAAMLSSAGVASKPYTEGQRVRARVCRFWAPELLESNKASRDARVQREIETLRSLQRVGSRSKIIANTRVFGGDGPANAPVPDEALLSLQSLHTLKKVKSERVDGAD